MRKIAIIGAGQGGLSLATVLQKLGYSTTLYSNRTSEQILNGRIMSTQVMFDRSLQFERKWGLNHWDDECPWGNSIMVSVGIPGEPKLGIQWKGMTQERFQSIDQRLKFSSLLDRYDNMGGKVIIKGVNIEDLDHITQQNELTIVAGGKGEISQAFARDEKRSVFDKPQRGLGCMFVSGMIRDQENFGVRTNVIPGIGEYFSMPVLSRQGSCDAMLFEAIPGGPMDKFHNKLSPEEHLEIGREILRTFIPWEAERCERIRLIDDQATLAGRFTPVIREPFAKMPCGKAVLGMADTIVLNDPIAGQGSNNAGKCAEIYLKGILEREGGKFDEEWMQKVFEEFWKESAEASTMFSNMLLSAPPPHVLEFLATGMKVPNVADQFSHAFENPASLFPWILTPEGTKEKTRELEGKKVGGIYGKKEEQVYA